MSLQRAESGRSAGTAEETGSSRPEGAKRQRKARRAKPNRAERRALLNQKLHPPLVNIDPDGTSVEVLQPAPVPKEEAVRRVPAQGQHSGAAEHKTSRSSHGYRSKEAELNRRRHSSDMRSDGAHRVPMRHKHHAAGSEELYAALDLGTNNCRLLIARPEQRGFRVVDAYSKIVRLGEGVGRNRRLSDDAISRAIEALQVCQQKISESGVQRARLIATEACRAAENGEEFVQRAKKEAGLELEIVSQETEARLAVAGCVSLVDPEADGVLLFDIGGGSSEIVWLDLRNRYAARGFALTRFVRTWMSLPLGVVNLAELHGGVHVTPDVFEAMVSDVSKRLQNFPLGNELSRAIERGNVHMLGTSGTVTTLAGVHLGLKRYDRRRVDGTWMEQEDVAAMINQLLNMSYQERVENPCIGEDRADLVLAGCAILEGIRRRWPCQRLRVADRGLREGILMEMMAADKVWSNSNQKRRRAPRKEYNK
ncbi:Exopolyphosphatase [Pseudovibrio axinellae]|uniref:Exopolyphosphatase n=1 Tax=Pseudovibrio axinellae TaxID=989403 RepID=A0A165XLF2_9HYPH|nr:Ppx/GppA phosphatase family protein [Pseudovibrio axinellae]KZL17817.1 Exopolyphosphatase [Pseudovibrio axinellae]SEP71205.1 Ppx/GppA phosphatase [Pseudovibrio axinellae]